MLVLADEDAQYGCRGRAQGGRAAAAEGAGEEQGESQAEREQALRESQLTVIGPVPEAGGGEQDDTGYGQTGAELEEQAAPAYRYVRVRQYARDAVRRRQGAVPLACTRACP